MKEPKANDTPFQQASQTSPNGNHTVDTKEIRRFANLLMNNGQVIETRVLDGMLLKDRPPYDKPRVIAGWFDSPDALVSEIKQIASAAGIYATINPCTPELRARANNRLKDKKITATTDQQIVRRQYLFLDADPEREGHVTGIPSNEREHQLALDFVETVCEELKHEGWPDAIRFDTGNGGCALFAIDQPAHDNGLVERVLKGLAQRFDTEQVHFDQTTFNQSRIMRIPGTWNCKGDGIEDRPHRMARIIHIPDEMQIVPTELLEATAIPVGKEQKQEQKIENKSISHKKSGQLPTGYLDQWGVAYRDGKPYNGGQKWQLVDGCPFCGNNDHNAFVYISSDNELGFKCSHNSCKGLRWKDFRLHFKQKSKPRSSTTTHSPGQEQASNLPCIILGGQLRDIRDRALLALGQYEEEDPTIFIQGSRLVQIGHDESHKAIIRPMGIAEMKNALTRAADFYTTRQKGDDIELVPAKPPKDIAEAILALDPSQWPFLSLVAIVETPVTRPNGTILQNPGYDEQTRLYYAPHKDMHICKVPDNPTKEEVQNARAILEDIIAEFPFVDQSDRANMLALMITPITRPAIKRHVPQALIDAPKQGTGKGLLSDIVSIIATGEPASILTAPNNEEEWAKKITSILMCGSTIITIDNIPGRLQSSKLDAVLTADWWIDRLLGGNTMIKVPHRATWMATGNNIKVGGDLARRCYRIRIDPKISKPWNRTGFKYEDLATHVKEYRSEKVTAILTLVRAWFAAGCPIDKNIPSLGTFTGWARMVGSILSFAGIKGFLQNLDKLYDEMDEENAQWAIFLQAWKDTFGNQAIFIKELVAALTEEEKEVKQEPLEGLDKNSTGGDEKSTGGCLADSLPDSLQNTLRSIPKEKQKNFNVSLSKQLEKRVDTCFGENNLSLKKERDKDRNTTKWSVVSGGSGGSFTPSARESFSSDESAENNSDVKYSNDLDNLRNLRNLRNEESSINGKNGANQDGRMAESLSNAYQEDFFTGEPPVKTGEPPVDSRLPDRVCYVCNQRDWSWDEILEMPVCSRCSHG